MRRILSYIKFVYNDTRWYRQVRALRRFFRFRNGGTSKYITKRNAELMLNVHHVLPECLEVLSANGIFVWLDFGTLLGAYREHNILAHDYDVDLGTWSDETSPERVEQVMLNSGFRLFRVFEIDHRSACQSFEKLGVVIDIMYYHRSTTNGNQTMFCYDFEPIDNIFVDHAQRACLMGVKKDIFPFAGFIEIDFLGSTANIPSNSAEYLAAYYGADFMTPDPNFYGHCTPCNIEHLDFDEKFAIFKQY